MQRKRQYIFLGLIPLGAIGALASGVLPMPWQFSPSKQPVISNVQDAGAKSEDTAGAERRHPKSMQQAASQTASRRGSDVQPTKTARAASQPVPPQSAAPSKRGKFGIDVARITTEGSSVIAGYAKPSSRVTVMADGKPVGVATADQSGDWVLITPHQFANLDPKLEIKEGDLFTRKVAALGKAGLTAMRPQSSPATERTAVEVTKQMMRRLKRLTDEASTKARAAAATPRDVAAKAPAPSDGHSGTSAGPGSEKTGRRQVAGLTLPKPMGLGLQTGPGAQDAVETARATGALPVPVQFLYRKAEFTDQGRAAAALLLRYFKVRGFKSVSLSGHADERGSTAANYRLSSERLKRIEEFLRQGGFSGKLRLVPKGESEKYAGVDRSKFSAEELYQLDRRVEVIEAR